MEESKGIRIPKELQHRIKVQAALADLTIGEYLDTIVPPLPVVAQAPIPGKKS